MPDIPFGRWSWLPDQPEFEEPHLREALGCLPGLLSYKPLPDVAGQSDPLSARVRGAIAVRDKGGDDVHIYAGTSTTIEELQSDGTWSDVSRTVGGAYTASSDSDRWNFAPFGDRMIATDFVDVMQYIDMSTGTNFENLPNAPNAKYVTAFKGFVMVGYTTDSAYMAKWSGLNDSEEWAPGTDQSDEIEFEDGGIITGVKATDACYYFQEYAIQRFYYVGLPTVFQRDTIERSHGCFIPGSLVQYGRRFFYRASDGFYMFDGQSEDPIGGEQVDQFFLTIADPNFYHRMSVGVDPLKKIVTWNFTSVNAADGAPDHQLHYNWISKRWTQSPIECELIVTALSLGMTLEDLDALFSSVDAMTISLDDPIWAGGATQFGAFTPSFEYGSFSGANIAARFEPSVFKPNGAGRSFLIDAHLLIDTADSTLAAVCTERAGDQPSAFSAGTAQEENGRVPLRGAGRFVWFRAEVPAGADWTNAQGIDEIGTRPAGNR